MPLFRRFSRICEHTFLADHLSPESVVVDLGANQGAFSVGIRRDFRCRVVAVEPVPTLATRLRALNLGPVHEAVIGGADTPAVLHVFEHRCASVQRTCHEPVNEGLTIPVRRTTLRQLCADEEIARINLLKVDIEGAEVELFAAMTVEDYTRIDQITIEFHDFLYPDTKPQVIATIAAILSHGFVDIPFSLDHTDILFIHPERCRFTRLNHLAARHVQRNAYGVMRRLRRAGDPFKPSS
jgi:FkbM family methyltransferase